MRDASIRVPWRYTGASQVSRSTVTEVTWESLIDLIWLGRWRCGYRGLVRVGDDGKGNEADAERDVDVAIHFGGFRSALHGCIGSGNRGVVEGKRSAGGGVYG